MRRGLLSLMLLLALLLAGCSEGESKVQTVSEPMFQKGADNVWMYAVSAGKADALLVSVDGQVCLIDAGYGRSMGKIRAAMEMLGVEKLDAVFVTHTDDDHTEGLEWLAASDIPVGAWYASAMFIDVKESKHPAVKAASERGQSVNWLRAGDSVPLGSAVLDVLAPSVLDSDKDDNNSLVLMLRSAEGNILLAGDIELPAESILLASGADVKCDVLKVANHADDDTTGAAFVQASSPKLAVICTDSAEKPETPDSRVVASLKGVGAEVAVTQDCTGGIYVSLKGGEPTATFVDLPQPAKDVSIERVTAGEDTVMLRSTAKETVSLDGWYLYSEKGGEMFIFPRGTVVAPGGQLTVGTNTTGGAFDLLWDDKKVIHQSKEDVITLFDGSGMPVSVMSNGK